MVIADWMDLRRSERILSVSILAKNCLKMIGGMRLKPEKLCGFLIHWLSRGEKANGKNKFGAESICRVIC